MLKIYASRILRKKGSFVKAPKNFKMDGPLTYLKLSLSLMIREKFIKSVHDMLICGKERQLVNSQAR
jgi:hypothetical protein